MANFDLRTFLTENKLTRVSKTLVKENDQNLSSSPKLFASFDENIETIYAYEDLGFNVQEDDDVNNIFSAELQFDGLDWMAVLAVLEDCERAGLDPNMSWNGKQYTFEEAMKLVDSKAAGGMNEAPANKTSEDKLPTIKISKDIYYFDKLGRLDTKDNVDEKYHNRADLIFKKGQTIKDDTKYEDSDYKMITSSTSLEKGIDYSDDGKAAGGMNEAPANEAITEGDSFDYSNLILSTINSLTDMGEEGENALRVLGKISDWNEVVRLATEE
jgi:hypothetical protein